MSRQTLDAGGVQSVARAVGLLEAVGAADSPVTLNQLAEVCGLQRATAWRLLVTLEQTGLIERDTPRGGYRIGPRLIAIASAAGGDTERIARLARPHLEWLCSETALTAAVSALTSGRVEVIDQVDPPSVFVLRWVGKEFPLHTSSPGKLVLAWLPDDELQAVLSGHLPRLTPKTVTDRAALRAELRRVRASRTAVSYEEFELGCVGISCAIQDHDGALRGAATLTGPIHRMQRARLADLGNLVRVAATRIEDDLRGHRNRRARARS